MFTVAASAILKNCGTDSKLMAIKSAFREFIGGSGCRVGCTYRCFVPAKNREVSAMELACCVGQSVPESWLCISPAENSSCHQLQVLPQGHSCRALPVRPNQR